MSTASNNITNYNQHNTLQIYSSSKSSQLLPPITWNNWITSTIINNYVPILDNRFMMLLHFEMYIYHYHQYMVYLCWFPFHNESPPLAIKYTTWWYFELWHDLQNVQCVAFNVVIEFLQLTDLPQAISPSSLDVNNLVSLHDNN